MQCVLCKRKKNFRFPAYLLASLFTSLAAASFLYQWPVFFLIAFFTIILTSGFFVNADEDIGGAQDDANLTAVIVILATLLNCLGILFAGLFSIFSDDVSRLLYNHALLILLRPIPWALIASCFYGYLLWSNEDGDEGNADAGKKDNQK